jgi:hypothetical protein
MCLSCICKRACLHACHSVSASRRHRNHVYMLSCLVCGRAATGCFSA